jgi:L-ascorbate metabolism protein UlaG (beta-lactamase superfamily)
MSKPYYQGPPSDHFDGTRFFVPGHNQDKSRKDLFRMLWSGKRAKWPSHFASPHNHKPADRVSDLRSTLIGHASFLLQVANLNLLIDPVFADRASPVSFTGPKRVNPPGVSFDDLPPIDAVLITHNHYDHFDEPTLWRIEKRWQPRFILPLGVDHTLRRGKKQVSKFTTLDWGRSATLGNIDVHAVPTYHWSARGTGDRRKTLWCSFVITSPAGTVYHIGDTGYGAGEFSKTVAKNFGPIDLAHIPIGAYEPRWFMSSAHVNPQEAVQIFQDCEAKKAIGHHWGTFQLTDEAIQQPKEDLAAALEAAKISPRLFQAFQPGQVFSL